MSRKQLMEQHKELLPVTIIANKLVQHYTALVGNKYERIAILASCQLIADEIVAELESKSYKILREV